MAEALRRRRASDDMRIALSAAGHRDFPYDPEGAAERLAQRRISPVTQATAIARYAEAIGQPVNEVRDELTR